MGANPEKLRHALAEGVGIAWFALGSLPLLEIGAQGGADVALLDFQHGLWTKQDAHLAAGLVQLPILVRVADTSIGRIGEALDSGACGILAPQIDTADQARRVVNAAHYPPRGVRSGGGVRPLSRGFDYNYEHFRHPVIGMMMKSAEGVANAQAIAEVEGVDFLFVGTGDLALSLGCFPQIDRRLEAAARTVLEACRHVGISCGIFTRTAEAARLKRTEGFQAVVIADDIDVALKGFSRAAQLFRGD